MNSMKKNVLLFIFLSYPENAFAYIDPGTVSIILQGLIGAAAAIIVTLKIYWNKFIHFFNFNKKTNVEEKKKVKNKSDNNKKKD